MKIARVFCFLIVLTLTISILLSSSCRLLALGIVGSCIYSSSWSAGHRYTNGTESPIYKPDTPPPSRTHTNNYQYRADAYICYSSDSQNSSSIGDYTSGTEYWDLWWSKNWGHSHSGTSSTRIMSNNNGIFDPSRNENPCSRWICHRRDRGQNFEAAYNHYTWSFPQSPTPKNNTKASNTPDKSYR